MSSGMTKDPTNQFTESNSIWVRVLAGPGTGKSYNLKERLKYLVKTKSTKPEKILVLTFTSVAVQDLKNDIDKLKLGKIKVSTLHALAIELLGKSNSVRLMLDFEVDTMLRDLEPNIGKDFRRKKAMLKELESGDSSEAITDDERDRFVSSLTDWLNQHHGYILDNLIPEACDYLRKCSFSGYDWIMVDEYQDLNPTEQEFVELLMSEKGHLTVIGDDDQSIYEFKGAKPDGIRQFAKNEKHIGCEEICFPECRRCPTWLVDRASTLIKNNRDREDKEFTAYLKNIDEEDNYVLKPFHNAAEEIEGLCEIIKEEQENRPEASIVVLSPTKSRGRKLYDALQNAGIDAALCYRDAVFDSKEVRERFSLLSLAASPEDLISWRYLLGEEKVGLRALSYKRIREDPETNRSGILEVLNQCADEHDNHYKIRYTKSIIERYKAIIKDLEEINKNQKDHKKLIELLGANTKSNHEPYNDLLKRAIETKMECEGFTGVRRAILDEAYSPKPAAAKDRIRIMSLHSAKGLSAATVIIMSAAEGLIPLRGKGSVEEQRRLFYVAITRCKEDVNNNVHGRLVITTFIESNNGTAKDTSRFVLEMGEPQKRRRRSANRGKSRFKGDFS